MQHANYTLVIILRCLAKKRKLYWYLEKYGNWIWKRQFLRGLGLSNRATKSILRIYHDNSFKVLLWSKIDFYFFFDVSKVLMSNTYHAKFQVFMSTGSAINWATISDFDRPRLQNLHMTVNNWESRGGRGKWRHPIKTATGLLKSLN